MGLDVLPAALMAAIAKLPLAGEHWMSRKWIPSRGGCRAWKVWNQSVRTLSLVVLTFHDERIPPVTACARDFRTRWLYLESVSGGVQARRVTTDTLAAYIH